MKTITDSLKNFYAKLGGNPSNLPSRSTSADIIDAMSDVYTDKEGTHVEVTTQVTEGTKIATVKTNNEDHDIYVPTELPSVTSSDEGKVLSVNSSGAWVAGSSENIETIQGTYNSSTGVLSIGLTPYELAEKCNFGSPEKPLRIVFALDGRYNDKESLYLSYYGQRMGSDADDYSFVFSGIFIGYSSVSSMSGMTKNYATVTFTGNSDSSTNCSAAIEKYTMTPAT